MSIRGGEILLLPFMCEVTTSIRRWNCIFSNYLLLSLLIRLVLLFLIEIVFIEQNCMSGLVSGVLFTQCPLVFLVGKVYCADGKLKTYQTMFTLTFPSSC